MPKNSQIPKWLQLIAALAAIWSSIYLTRDWLLIPIAGIYNVAASVLGSDIAQYVLIIALPGTILFWVARYTSELLARIIQLERAVDHLSQSKLASQASQLPVDEIEGTVRAIRMLALSIALAIGNDIPDFRPRMVALLSADMNAVHDDLNDRSKKVRDSYLAFFKAAMSKDT